MELLSPAGSYEALVAAVQSGADAVYLGGEKFGARAGAKNFTVQEMKKWIDYCHLYGVKVYITVNTLIKDSEINEMIEYIKAVSDANADAVIIQDFGVLKIVNETVPELEVHGSTQMTLTSAEDVKFLEDLGFSRVVLSRELSKDEIKKISDNVNCELEVFVHGALCMSYSGQCLFSSIIGGRSGNRGCCAQPCRLQYTVEGDGDEKKNFVLSPKDLCLVSQLDELRDAGAASLKIEGRLKRAEYVAAVTSVYRKYLDNRNCTVSGEDIKELKNAFARGFTKGKFGGDHGRKMMSFENSSNVSENIFSDEVKSKCNPDRIFRKIPVTIKAIVKKGEPVSIIMTDGVNNVSVKGEKKAETAIKVPLDKNRISENLSKLGNTPFEAIRIEAETEENISLPVSEINAVRRIACEKLAELRVLRNRREIKEFNYRPVNKTVNGEMYIVCNVHTKEQLDAAKKCGIKRIYAPADLCAGDECVVRCAEISKSDSMKKGERFFVSSVGEIRKYSGKELHGSARLNITNSLSAGFYSGFMKSIILSPELKLTEIKSICSNTDAEIGVIGYGRLDLMLCENCPLKAAGKCQNHKNIYRLKDRMNEKFPFVCTDGCQMRILNSKPVYMADKAEDLISSGLSFISLDFTLEDGKTTEKIIKAYIDALSGKKADSMPENTFTRGHFYRGVK